MAAPVKLKVGRIVGFGRKQSNPNPPNQIHQSRLSACRKAPARQGFSGKRPDRPVKLETLDWQKGSFEVLKNEMSLTEQGSEASRGAWFATTHWTVVFAAKDGDTQEAEAARELLCRAYWRPIYAFIRREDYNVEDAQDLTQEFFARFLEKRWLNHLKHRNGRFRSFLLTLLKHFLADQRDHVRARKRGGDYSFVSLAEFAAEDRECLEPADYLTPDQIYERRWVQTLFDQAAHRLRMEYLHEGKAELFDHLKELPPGNHGPNTYAEIGACLGLSEGAIKSAVHRFRQRHSEILREEIARTVGDPSQWVDEVRHLLGVLNR
jgi:RNA polymerase sigma factor (sigma-70 family)